MMIIIRDREKKNLTPTYLGMVYLRSHTIQLQSECINIFHLELYPVPSDIFCYILHYFTFHSSCGLSSNQASPSISVVLNLLLLNILPSSCMTYFLTCCFHLDYGFRLGHFPSGFIFKVFFAILSLFILKTCSYHLIPLLIECECFKLHSSSTRQCLDTWEL